MKRLLSLMLVVIAIINSAFSVSAEPETEEPIGTEIIEEYLYTDYISSDLSISNKTATCASIVYGSPPNATKIVITQTLQKKNGLSWTDVKSWTKTFNSWLAMYNTSKSSLSSGTYRLNHQTKIFYNTVTPSYGTRLNIKGNAGYYGASVSGGWTP